MESYPVGNKTSLSRKPYIPDKKLLWITIRKSCSLFQNPSWKNCLKRPLADKSWWSHIRLAIKPRYLGNLTPQMKSYYGSLSGSHARSFRIRHEKSREAPSGGGLTITSYPVGNTTSVLHQHYDCVNNWFFAHCMLNCLCIKSTKRFFNDYISGINTW